MATTPIPPGISPGRHSQIDAVFVAGKEKPGQPRLISVLGSAGPLGKMLALRAGGTAAQPGPPTEVIGDLKQALDHLPVDISAILTVVQELSQQVRKANVLARDSELMAQFNALMKSADEMQTAANFRLCAGIIQGAVQGLMACYQAYASGQAAIEAASGVAPQNEAKTLQDQAKTLNSQAEQMELQAKSAPAASPEPATEEIAAPAKKPGQETRQSLEDVLADKPVVKAAKQEISQSLEDFVAEPRTAEQFQSEARMLRQRADDSTATANERLAEVKAINARAESISNEAALDVKLFEGLSGVLTALLNFGSEASDTKAKGQDVDAKAHESGSAKASEAIQQASEILRDALQKMESVEQAKTNTNLAIARNLG